MFGAGLASEIKGRGVALIRDACGEIVVGIVWISCTDHLLLSRGVGDCTRSIGGDMRGRGTSASRFGRSTSSLGIGLRGCAMVGDADNIHAIIDAIRDHLRNARGLPKLRLLGINFSLSTRWSFDGLRLDCAKFERRIAQTEGFHDCIVLGNVLFTGRFVSACRTSFEHCYC